MTDDTGGFSRDRRHPRRLRAASSVMPSASSVLPARPFCQGASLRKTLQVFRTFEDGRRIAVGRVEETDGNVVFRYDGDYLSTFAEATGSLSPLTLPYAQDPYSTPRNCPAGLPGFLAESLPDGYGL